MSEKFGLDGIWEDLKNNLIVSTDTYEDDSSELPLVTEFTITNGDLKSDNEPEIFFDEVTLTVGVPPNLHTEKYANLAGGDSFTYKYRSHYSDLGRILFNVEGKVSPERLLRIRHQERNVPIHVAGLSIPVYVKVIKDLNLNKWLKGTIEVMRIPNSDTDESEIEDLKNTLRNATDQIEETKKQLENILRFVIRKTDAEKQKINQHRKIVEDFLNDTARACSESRKMLDKYNSRSIESSLQTLVNQLSREAELLDQATEELA